MKIHWTGIGAALVSIAGIASSPAVLNLLPPKYAALVTAAGVVAQGLTHKAVQPEPTP